MRKNFNALRIVIQITAGFLLFEIYLFLTNTPNWLETVRRGSAITLAEPDMITGWRNKPGNYKLLDPAGNQITVTINNNHSRITGNEVKDTVSQVVFIGDSFTYGYGLSDSETFPWLLQTKFRELSIVNTATPGFGTYQAFLQSKKIRSETKPAISHFIYLFNSFHEERNIFNPGRILSMYSKNASDLNVPYCEMGQALDCKSSPLIAPWPLSMRFRVVAMLQEAYLKFTSNTNFNEKRLVTLEILKQMGSQLTAEGTRVYLILYEIDPQSKKEYQEFLSKTNINVIDCSNIVQLHKREDLILQDGHPNAFAAGLIAECIEKSIPNLGLLHQD